MRRGPPGRNRPRTVVTSAHSPATTHTTSNARAVGMGTDPESMLSDTRIIASVALASEAPTERRRVLMPLAADDSDSGAAAMTSAGSAAKETAVPPAITKATVVTVTTVSGTTSRTAHATVVVTLPIRITARPFHRSMSMPANGETITWANAVVATARPAEVAVRPKP